MYTKKIFITVISALALASCVSKADPETLNYIGLSAYVGKLQVKSEGTKGQPVQAAPYEEITSLNPLNARLLFSFDKKVFEENPSHPYFGECAIPCHTNVSYSGADFEFIKYDGRNLTYPSGEIVWVYCSGLYPQTGWSVQTVTEETAEPGVSGSVLQTQPPYSVAKHAIDGSTDIMFADVISGSWTIPFASQGYRHLQTWIKVLVSANTNDAAAKWGNITKITVQSESYVNILYGQANGSSYIKYSHNIENTPDGETHTYKDLCVYNDTGAGFPLSITTAELGSVFVVPPADCILDLMVYTTTFPEGKPVKVKLYDLQNNLIQARNETIGKLFVLNLNFTNINVIEGVCTLNYWNDQDDDLYLE